MKTEVQRLNEFQREAPELIRGNLSLMDFLTDNGYFKPPQAQNITGIIPVVCMTIHTGSLKT